ncbi:MAG: hypothetical protein LIR50_19265 [Bacillota bacterium]|nr:hypothetical protein [Bacillota bacterium]
MENKIKAIKFYAKGYGRFTKWKEVSKEKFLKELEKDGLCSITSDQNRTFMVHQGNKNKFEF